jgi:protein involved in polysaccharide export with SLBB domain
MLRLFLLTVALGVVSACSPYRAIHKTNEQFKLLCESVAAGATAAPATTTNETDAAKLKPKLIAAGMQITVNVAEDTSLNRTYSVLPGCALEFAAVGRITVCGLTTDEVAGKIREVLERDFFQKATVTVFIESALSTPERPGAGSGVVYIVGDVNRPGPLLLPQTEVFTVAKAIIAAGGFTQFAKSSSVQVVRYCEDGKKYDTFLDVDRIMKKAEFERDIPLRANDWIVVGQKFISF